MKILITSDNHIGYKETDPLRGEDSFITFEEALILANHYNVDLIIQGGDLFHENRPSRNTIAKTVSLIKKYTLGDKEINFFCNKKMNYEDPDMNISIPILCIHGNHDDPSGVFTKSALDILESTNLVNYGGKVTSIEQIEIDPYVFNGKIAVFLLGNIRDRRLYHLFVSNRITFKRPKEALVNILVVHQNRVQYGVKDYLPHEFLPEWFDLVVYGHEHESVLMNLKNFVLMQPGSTVRTSLAKQESFDKFVYLVETDTLKIERIQLKTVRPFFTVDCELDEENIENILCEKVESLLELSEKIQNNEKADSNLYEICENLEDSGLKKRIKIDKTVLPLIRIRAKINDMAMINNHKFGIQFKTRVANWNDILQLSRPKKKRIELEKVGVEEKTEFYDILKNNLNCLAINEKKFIKSLSDFVEKDEKNAFSSLIKNAFKLNTDRLGKDKNDIVKRMEEIKKLVILEEDIVNLSEINDKDAFTDLL